jgi:hypothetical protein
VNALTVAGRVAHAASAILWNNHPEAPAHLLRCKTPAHLVLVLTHTLQVSKTRLLLGTLLGRTWREDEVLLPFEQLPPEKLARRAAAPGADAACVRVPQG